MHVGNSGTKSLCHHHRVSRLRNGGVGWTQQTGTYAAWLEGVCQAPQYDMVGLRVGAASAPGVCKSGAPGHPLPGVVGNTYGLKAPLWEPQLCALERETLEIWELRVPKMLFWTCGFSNRESLSQGMHCCLFSFLSSWEKWCILHRKCDTRRTGHLLYNSSPSLKPFCSLCCMVHSSHKSCIGDPYFPWGFTYRKTIWRGAYCPVVTYKAAYYSYFVPGWDDLCGFARPV